MASTKINKKHVYRVKLRRELPPNGILVSSMGRNRSVLAIMAKRLLIVDTPTAAEVVDLVNTGIKIEKLPELRTPPGGDPRGPTEG